MRRTLLGIVLAALTPAMAHAVELPVKLRDGAIWTQTSKHTRTDTREGGSRSTTATSVTRSTYRKVGDVGTLRVDFVSFDVEGVEGEAKAALVEKAKLIYPAVLEVDAELAPVRVRDWEKMRETIFQALAGTIPDERTLETAKSMFAGMSDVQAASLFKEQSLVALGQGSDLEPGAAAPYESEIPNILGGPPIKASGVFQLESVDKAKGRAVLTWVQKPDPASMAASLKVSMEAMLARVAPEKQAEAKVQFAKLTLERQEGCRYEIDMATGLAATTDCTVEITAGLPPQTGQRVERWVITLSAPEPR